MHINDFVKLDLKIGDYIWIMDEKGEGSLGNFDGGLDLSKLTFQFRNHSNGHTETIKISNLQRVELNPKG